MLFGPSYMSENIVLVTQRAFLFVFVLFTIIMEVMIDIYSFG